MIPYKHYSFDLWLTLIRSNPLFKQKRSRYFHEHYNHLSKPLTEVEAIFRQVDVMCNTINEKTGKNIDADEMYLIVISQINENKISLQDIDTDALYLAMEYLIMEYMPMIYSDDTADVLAYIKEQPGTTTNILSNTGFIKGSTLRHILHKLSIEQYFDFQLYSDETGYSKPSKILFNSMINNALELQPLALQEIIHIGDNPWADIRGAEAIGISAMLINANNIPITQLIQYASSNILAT